MIALKYLVLWEVLSSLNLVTAVRIMELLTPAVIIVDGCNGSLASVLPERKSVSMLIIVNSDIKRIDAESFSNAYSSVSRLELSLNKIGSIESGAFVKLGSLEIIEFRANNLECIQAGIFKHLSRLQVLKIEEEEIKTIPDNFFSGLYSLKSVAIIKNQITQIGKYAFVNTMIENLSLEYNNLEVLDVGIFRQIAKLKVLNLANNQISSLNPGTFWGLNLHHLNLKNNRLIMVEADSFSGLITEELDLSNNYNLIRIQENSFSHCQIAFLHLMNTSIVNVKKSVWGIQNSSEVFLTANSNSSWRRSTTG